MSVSPILFRPDHGASLVMSPITDSRELCGRIVACVARDFAVDPSLLLAHTRGVRDIARARQIAMYLAHIGYGLDFAAIGRVFHRDRTTVAHACRLVEDGRDDLWFDRRLAALERTCRSRIPYLPTAGERQ